MSANSSYETLLKEIRHRYELKYGKKIDDEIIYLIIRMNELEMGIKTELNDLKSIVANQSKIKPHIIKTVEKSEGRNVTLIAIKFVSFLIAIQFIFLIFMFFKG